MPARPLQVKRKKVSIIDQWRKKKAEEEATRERKKSLGIVTGTRG